MGVGQNQEVPSCYQFGSSAHILATQSSQSIMHVGQARLFISALVRKCARVSPLEGTIKLS